MARIPDYSQRQVGIRPVSAQGFSMQAPDASGLARGIEQVESGVMRRAEQAREQADTAFVLDQVTNAERFEQQLKFDPENGLFNLKGKDALDVTNQAVGAFGKYWDGIESQAKNDQQRLRLRQVRASRETSLSQEMNQYEFNQREAYKTSTEDGAIDSAVQGGILYYNDPEKLAHYQQLGAGIVGAQAVRQGLSEEAAQAKLTGFNSRMASGVIQRTLVSDPYKARDYYQQVKDQMTADDQVRIGNQIDVKIDQMQLRAQAAADRREAKAERAMAQYQQQIASGIPATAESLKRWQDAAAGTSVAHDFNSLSRSEREVQAVLRQPPASQIEYLQKQEAKLQREGGTVTDAANLNRLRQAINSTVKQLDEAPLQFFQGRMGVDIPPLDIGGDEFDLAAQLGERIDIINGMRKENGAGVSMKPLLPHEATALSGQLESMTPDQQADTFAKLNRATGDQSAYLSIMRQIAPDSPVRAMAGALAAKQEQVTLNSRWFRDDDVAASTDVARTVLIGESLLNKTKAQKAGDGNPKTFPMPADQQFNLIVSNELGDVFAGAQQPYELASQAIRAYYAGKSSEVGDYSGQLDNGRLREAVRATVGNPVSFNSGPKVLAPWGMAEDVFKERATLAIEDALEAMGESPAMSRSYSLRNAGDGSYYVTQGQQFKYDADGRPMMIEVSE